MTSDSPDLPGPPPQQLDPEHFRFLASRLLPSGGNISPVHVRTTSLSLPTTATTTPALTPRRRNEDPHGRGTPTHLSAPPVPLPPPPTPPQALKPQPEWMVMRKMRTAPNNDGPSRPGPATAPTVRSVSEGQSPRKQTVRRETLRRSPRCLAAPNALAATLCYETSSDESTSLLPHAGYEEEEEEDETSSASLPCHTGSGDSAWEVRRSPAKATRTVNDTPSSHEHAHGRSRSGSAACTPSTLPPLPSSAPPPRAPTALCVPSPQSRPFTLSPSRSGERVGSGELPRLPLSISPVEAHHAVRSSPSQLRLDRDAVDRSISPTLPDVNGVLNDQLNGSETALSVRPGKRVGRGFSRRSREAEFGELLANASSREQVGSMATVSDLVGEGSSTGLLGPHSGVIERNRRTSISFNNHVALADDDATDLANEDDLHCLCDVPHHQSVAQPQPLSILDASFSTLSSTTIYKRDGVTYII